MVLTAGSVVAPLAHGTPGQTEHEKALASLVEAERAFSRTSDEKGIREAFLTWLAPDAVVFRPLPVEGRPVYESMDPANPAHLVWEPEVAEIAASGELGYTSGPYRMGPQRGAEPTRFGHYVSVWKKQPDGAWRVFLDIGVQHDRPSSSAPVTNVASPPAPADVEALSPEALRDAEQAVGNIGGRFESTVGARGYRKALAELATEDVRVYRPGRFPTAGKARIKDLVAPSSGLIVDPGSQRRLGRYQALVAWSGDLACTYGTSEYAKTKSDVETTSFLKIWRKDRSGAWKISLDIEIPVPAEAKRTG
jgi:ketosteroid isomerase-like protein